MKPFPISEIKIEPERQRKFFDMAKVIELANSIQSLGLLQPIVIQPDGTLVAGERRLRAIKHLLALGIPIRANGEILDLGLAPTLLFGDPSEIALCEAQLDENIRREDLTWQERAAALDLRHRLRVRSNPSHTLVDTAKEVTGGNVGDAAGTVHNSIKVAKYLADKEVSAAPTLKDAIRVLRRREEKTRLATLAENVDVTKLSDTHILHKCDWRTASIELSSIDVILTDPPYGMGADSFKDGGDASAVLHSYSDISDAEWQQMMQEFFSWAFLVTKPKAHLYVFCDIDQYPFLRAGFSNAGFRVHRTPLVYAKSHVSSRRVPWPTSGPRRGYELILYAVKGDRNVNAIKSDVLGPFSTDSNLGHAAQKPVELYAELLSRSVSPGDIVCDPFAGTGTIFPAAQGAKCRAIGCEIDPAFQGMCAERLTKLKEQA